LVAELVAGEIARVIGLRVPEIIFIEIDAALGRNEPDYEIRQLLKASAGMNLALDYLPGSTTFDPAARDTASAEEASLTVWLDSFTQNVDRTAKNANLLLWHRKLYLIDHGAALYFHHNWATMEEKIDSPFAPIEHHVLLPWASEIAQAAQTARGLLSERVFAGILAEVPDAWLEGIASGQTAEEKRAAYVDYLTRRLEGQQTFVEQARSAHARLV
jgi:hypothetical protein